MDRGYLGLQIVHRSLKTREKRHEVGWQIEVHGSDTYR